MLQSASRGGSGARGGSPWRGGVSLAGGVGGCSPWQGGFSLAGGVLPTGAPPPVNRMTNRCKNITLATTSLRPVKMFLIPFKNFGVWYSFDFWDW